MVDIHGHILPDLDDGARTAEESLLMLRIAAASGTTDIVATPHSCPEYRYRRAMAESRRALLAASSDNLPRIHLGCDFQIDYDLVQHALAHPREYTINGGRYLLIELPEAVSLKIVPGVIRALLGAGMVPILTHPERYFALRNKVAEVRTWVEHGCLLQITGQSLLGRFGSSARSMAEQLLDENLVQFIASDAHDAADRTPRLDEAYSVVEERWGDTRARALFAENPRATLTGTPLPERVEIPRRRKWFSFR